MEPTELTEEEQQLLTTIMLDKYSVGAFTGMIFKAYIDRPNDTILIPYLIKKALQVRIIAQNLTLKKEEKKE